MSAAILCIGTELTRGEITNGNAAWLGAELTALGLEVRASEMVPDDPELIGRTLQRLGESHQVIVTTGGLGPTTDDLTCEAVAQLLGVPLERDAEALEAIRERMTRRGRKMAASNEKQADFPRGSQVLSNERGTAPGFSVGIGKARSFSLPGVPHEMKAMFAQHIAPFVQSLQPDSVRQQLRLRTTGLPESEINDRLDGIAETHDVTLAYRAHFPEIEVKVVAQRADSAQAQHAARSAANEIGARLGRSLWGEGDLTLAEVVGEELRARKLWLATAESCTGGLVAKLFTDNSASDYFAGGCVTYSNDAKVRLLGVPEELLAQHGAVSAEVATAMAQGAVRRLEVDVGLSFTGIAGPTGGSADKPVGLVHYAVATKHGVTARREVFRGDRDGIRWRAAFAGLQLIRNVLAEGHDPS